MADPIALHSLPDGQAIDPSAVAAVPSDWQTAPKTLGLTGHPDDPDQPIPEWQDATGASLSRSSVALTVASATAGTWTTGTVTLLKGGLLYRVAGDASCGVRLYRDAASRTADLTLPRPRTTLPDDGAGVLAETWLGPGNSFTQSQSPVAVLYNDDGAPTTTIYYAVFNPLTVALAITVTLTILRVE